MKKAGILPANIICEKESGRDMNRPIWMRLKHRMRAGDTLTIMSIDRLGRNYDEILKNVLERDYIDSHREVSPLRQADDALLLDNSNMTIEEQKLWLLDRFHEVAGE